MGLTISVIIGLLLYSKLYLSYPNNSFITAPMASEQEIILIIQPYGTFLSTELVAAKLVNRIFEKLTELLPLGVCTRTTYLQAKHFVEY